MESRFKQGYRHNFHISGDAVYLWKDVSSRCIEKIFTLGKRLSICGKPFQAENDFYIRKATFYLWKHRQENPQKLAQLSPRSHPRHLMGKRTAQRDTIKVITSDSQVNSDFPYRWSLASLISNFYFYLFIYSTNNDK